MERRGAYSTVYDCKGFVNDVCGFDFYWGELFSKFLFSGNKTKRGVDFRHSTRNV